MNILSPDAHLEACQTISRLGLLPHFPASPTGSGEAKPGFLLSQGIQRSGVIRRSESSWPFGGLTAFKRQCQLKFHDRHCSDNSDSVRLNLVIRILEIAR